MALKHLPHWRERARLTQVIAAERLGISQAQLSRIETGESDTTISMLERMAVVYAVPLTRLVSEDLAVIKLIGAAGAGELVKAFDKDATFEEIEGPPGLHNPAAVVVRGDSMEPAYRDGDLLVFEQAASAPVNAAGQDCVCETDAGTVYVKTLQAGTRPDRFHLVSYNPRSPIISDARLRWAEPIRWIKRS